MKNFTFFLFLLLALGNSKVIAQFSISGLVYSDYDNSATLTASSNEGAIAGINVRAYNANDLLVASATTTGSGASNYTLSSLPNGSYRIEFTNLPAGYTPTRAGGTSVQFVTISGANVTGRNLGINHPSDYIQSNPYLYTTQFVSSSSTEVNQGVVVRFTRNGATSGRNQYIASYDAVGSVFSLATQSKTQRVFAAAYYRRGVKGVLGGSAGLGKIYVLNGNSTYTPPAASQTPLATITIPNAGTIPGTNPNAAVGKIGLGGIAISDDGNTLWAVNLNDKHLYRVDITNSAAPGTPVDMGAIPVPAALSGRPNDWRPFALKYYHGKLYVGGVSSGQTNNNSIAVDGDPGTAGVQAPSSLLSNTNYNMYTITDNISEVASYIVEIPNPLTAVTGSVVFSNTNMSYPRGRRAYQNAATDPRYTRTNGRWRAWTDTYVSGSNTTTMSVFIDNETGNDGTNLYDFYTDWPMPMLTNIDFEANGSLIFGFRDRSTDMTFAYYAAGDINKACWVPNVAGTATLNGVAGNWFWEGTAGSCNYPVADPNSNSGTEPDATPGLNMQQTREWFMNDETASVAGDYNHEEQTFGGLAYKPVFTDVAATSMNPNIGTYNRAGVEYFLTSNGSNPNSYQVENNTDPGRVYKSNALGDVEYMADLQPIELGNRIWNDVDGDGVQDAGEAALANISLEIFVDNNNDGIPDGATIGTTTTDASGNYYFNNSNITGDGDPNTAGVQATVTPGIRYLIRVAAADWTGGAGTGDLANFRLTATDITGNGAVDLSDNDASLFGSGTSAVPQISVVAGNAGENNHNLDFGFKQLASLGNRVWLDMGAGGGTANDGIQNGSEPGVAGVTVQLYRSTNVTVGDGDDVLVSSTVTDAYGNYRFDNLTPGVNYFVKVLPPANYAFSPQTNTTVDGAGDATGSDVNGAGAGAAFGASYMMTLTAGENEPDVDAGLVFPQATTQSLGNRIWVDNGTGGGTANDGVQNGNEPGMAGVVVSLYRDANNDGSITGAEATMPYATTITDATGNYYFTNLPTGNYQVGITLPAGFTYTPVYNAGGGTLGTTAESDTDSDIQVSGAGTGRTPLLTLDAGENLINVDGGLVATASNTASLGDFIWNDLDQDGVQDAGEPGIPGVTVTLYASDGTTVIATTTTDAFGGYSFTGLAAGSYVVGITTPSGYTISPQNVTTGGGNDLTDSDVNTATGKTAVINLVAGIRNTSVDAGLYQTSPAGTARLGNQVWFDNGIGGGTAGNGLKDGTEPGAAGVTVELLDGSGNSIDPDGAGPLTRTTTTTDANGNYQFVNLAAGNYMVQFSNLPNGFSFTQRTGTTDNQTDNNSDANTATGRTAVINLTAGESDQTIDAGLVSGTPAGKGSLGNKVFYDLDGDGIQDTGETGVAGVTVTLQQDLNNDGDFLDPGENNVSQQTTNSLGEYLFTGLNAGDYRVVFSAGPAGYNISPANAGANDNEDSDGNNAGLAISSNTSTTGTISLAQGEDNLSVDLGIVKTSATNGSISDRVWFDVNNDGDRDAATEPGVAGVTVTLYNVAAGVDGVLGTGDDVITVAAVTTTDANGYYLFDNLAPTTATTSYQVGFNSYPAGLTATSQTPTVTNDFSAGNGAGRTPYLTLGSGQNRTDVDFGLISTRASLGNFVWIDSDGDGIQDAGEPGVPGVTVLLYFDSNNDGDFNDAGENIPVTSMITDQNGGYLFTNLNAGNYQVEFTTIPAGLSFTTQDQTAGGGNDTNDSDAGANGRTATVTLAAGQANLTVDAGLYKPTATVGDRVWADNNNNNVQDAGDQGVAGVLVTLYTSAGVPVSSTVTDKNGNYLFTNVPPGNYYVGFSNVPNGVSFVIADVGADGADSDVNGANGAGTTATFNVPVGSVNLTIDAGLIYIQTLPVSIQLFAQKQGPSAFLTWIVSAERDVLSYTLERSANGRNFTAIYSINTTGVSQYNKTDVQPLSGVNYYRVKVTNLNGSVEYSEIRLVRFDSKGQVIIFPNPASDWLNIQLPDSWQGKAVQITLYNQAGQQMLNQSRSNASQVEGLNIGQLPVGIYNLRLVNANGDVEVRQVKKG